MRIALISDTHGSVPALEAAIATCRAAAPDIIVHASDFISSPFSPDPPGETIALLRTEEIRVVSGNNEIYFCVWNTPRWEATLAQRRGRPAPPDYFLSLIPPGVAELSPDDLAWLRSLPEELVLDGARPGDVYVCHAMPGNTWITPWDTDPQFTPDFPPGEVTAALSRPGVTGADLILCGHVPLPFGPADQVAQRTNRARHPVQRRDGWSSAHGMACRVRGVDAPRADRDQLPGVGDYGRKRSLPAPRSRLDLGSAFTANRWRILMVEGDVDHIVEREEPLGGGLTRPVRDGDTVRRATGPWTPAVHALLRHLEAVGFDSAPRVRGIDAQGREVLTFITGAVGWRPYPVGIFDDNALCAAARLVRRYHDAVRDFVPPPDSAWRFLPGAPREGIICHNNFAPYNAVYHDGRPHAFIDWDLGAPAPPAWDLAGAAYRFVPLYSDDQCTTLGMPLQPRGPRLRQFCDAYGLEDRRDFVALIRRHVQVCFDSDRQGGKTGEWSRRSLRYLDTEAAAWDRALLG